MFLRKGVKGNTLKGVLRANLEQNSNNSTWTDPLKQHVSDPSTNQTPTNLQTKQQKKPFYDPTTNQTPTNLQTKQRSFINYKKKGKKKKKFKIINQKKKKKTKHFKTIIIVYFFFFKTVCCWSCKSWKIYLRTP